MEHRDSPEIEPEPASKLRSTSARRFSRLVESAGPRRVAMPRLLVAGALTLLLTVLGAVGVVMLLRSAAIWVDQRPEHRIPFSQIELVPMPDPWIKGGALLILEEVRKEANRGESVPLLDLDLQELRNDFSRCPWVKKVLKIDRSRFGKLIVHLEYRKPVAVVPFKKFAPGAFVLDDEAVVLPARDIDWTIDNGPYLVRGMTWPLIKIQDVAEDSPTPKVGLPWKRTVEDGNLEDRDPMVLRAAIIARFLQDRRLSLSSPREAPNFVSIHLPQGPDKPFFLVDDHENLILWGKAPGDEKPGEPSPEARWAMLLAWIKAHGPLEAKSPHYLKFTNTTAVIDRSWSSKLK